MKVILTEAQLKSVVSEEIAENQAMINPRLAYAWVMKQLSMGNISLEDAIHYPERFSGRVREYLQNAINNLLNKNQQVTDKMKADAEETANDPHFKEKVEALKAYMETAAKNQNYNPQNIQITPEAMINACNQTKFDLPLLIAQAHLESCFGLTPRARKTNSVFSVGSYDNGKNAAKYATQNDSILPYINLMQNNYLGNRTVDDILKPGGFVNNQNMRYASDASYENKVKSIRNRVVKNYPILAS